MNTSQNYCIAVTDATRIDLARLQSLTHNRLDYFAQTVPADNLTIPIVVAHVDQLFKLIDLEAMSEDGRLTINNLRDLLTNSVRLSEFLRQSVNSQLADPLA